MIHSVDIDPDVIGNIQLKFDLNEETPIREGSEVTLSYVQPETGGLHDDSGHLLESFVHLVESIVDVAPMVEQVTVNGRLIEIRFDQLLHDDPADHPPASCGALREKDPDVECLKEGEFTWFRVQQIKMGSILIDRITVADSTVSLQLGERIDRTASVAVEYQSHFYDGGSRNLRDRSDPHHQVEGFKIPSDDYPGLTILNITSAHPTGGELDRSMPSRITVTFDGPLPGPAMSSGPWISVMAGQSSLGIKEISVQGSELAIILMTPVPECVDVTVEYSSEDGDWVDSSGRAIDSFSLPVDNFINGDWKLQCVRSDVGGLLLTFADPDLLDRQGFQWTLSVDGAGRELSVVTEEGVVELRPSTLDLRGRLGGSPLLESRRSGRACSDAQHGASGALRGLGGCRRRQIDGDI